MKDIVREKARVCDEFKECLIENQNKILAESTYNKKWGTGLNKRLTEATKPTFWPGTNLLGMLLMELTEEIIASESPAQSAEDAMEAVENAVLSRTVDVDVMTIEETGTEDVMSAVEATPIRQYFLRQRSARLQCRLYQRAVYRP
jgi:phosphoribosyl-dephospho-CoA transferase